MHDRIRQEDAVISWMLGEDFCHALAALPKREAEAKEETNEVTVASQHRYLRPFLHGALPLPHSTSLKSPRFLVLVSLPRRMQNAPCGIE